MTPVRMVLVEDEKMVAAMFMAWLRRHPQFLVVGHATNGMQALDLCREQKPDLAMIDVKLPGMDGLSLSAQVLEELPQLKILIVSSCCDAYCLYRINQLGLHGFVDKMSSLTELETALTTVASGKFHFSKLFREQMERQLKQPDAFHKILGQRKIEILHLLAMGLEDEKIANNLAISTVTVQTHRRNIRRKLSVHSDRALISRAQQLGLSLDHSARFPPKAGGGGACITMMVTTSQTLESVSENFSDHWKNTAGGSIFPCALSVGDMTKRSRMKTKAHIVRQQTLLSTNAREGAANIYRRPPLAVRYREHAGLRAPPHASAFALFVQRWRGWLRQSGNLVNSQPKGHRHGAHSDLR